MLSRARRRRIAAHSATCVAGVALAAAPAATAAELSPSQLPVPALPTLPAGGMAPGGAPVVPVPSGSGRCLGADARAGHASSASMRWAVLCLVNQQRARFGRGALTPDPRLMRAARRHAADMARRHYFGHVSPSGSSPLSRVRAAGWRGGVGEAIAWGCGSLSTPRATVSAWMASPPHRAIVLSRSRSVGVGYKRARGCGGRDYWVLDVG